MCSLFGLLAWLIVRPGRDWDTIRLPSERRVFCVSFFTWLFFSSEHTACTVSTIARIFHSNDSAIVQRLSKWWRSMFGGHDGVVNFICLLVVVCTYEEFFFTFWRLLVSCLFDSISIWQFGDHFAEARARASSSTEVQYTQQHIPFLAMVFVGMTHELSIKVVHYAAILHCFW